MSLGAHTSLARGHWLPALGVSSCPCAAASLLAASESGDEARVYAVRRLPGPDHRIASRVSRHLRPQSRRNRRGCQPHGLHEGARRGGGGGGELRTLRAGRWRDAIRRDAMPLCVRYAVLRTRLGPRRKLLTRRGGQDRAHKRIRTAKCKLASCESVDASVAESLRITEAAIWAG